MTQNEAYSTHGPAQSRWVVTCDHASNAVPDWVNGGDLGISSEDMSRHIAFDPGAAGVSKALADALKGKAVMGTFSRLVIDPNRAEDDPTLIMRLYDGTIIPANRHLTDADRTARLERLYLPYHMAVAEALNAVAMPLVVSIHSFTPGFRGRPPRPWHIGLLTATDRRLADPMFDLLAHDPDLCVGDNEPYTGSLKGDALDRHGLQTGHPHVLIELRNDLIATQTQQQDWADRLAPILIEAAGIAGL